MSALCTYTKPIIIKEKDAIKGVLEGVRGRRHI